ncbi:hypothetical protein SERLADRAFT_458396 [Serpula lacrymans var. lacrymans S7.9]|uniref:Uncharacterized protein n=1 Tax=Serpula lacrymans var. lacrymans (strain S7.9) TaxID=578457 RepID=F8NIR5_SERL9|nr:uncharacterized protein SERLADRAFT_458396 [Serpula lacrymans var. lacrymans S7.9]EGO29980.1 hypothetical protein SERLADRAFT_458396 [Serpula lacrymans var. lacrymans S7.9]
MKNPMYLYLWHKWLSSSCCSVYTRLPTRHQKTYVYMQLHQQTKYVGAHQLY